MHDIELEELQPDETSELLRRAQVVYLKLFEEHSKCSSSHCPGHGLPPMVSKMLATLQWPKDVVALHLAVKKWFSRIDTAGDGRLSEVEVVVEFTNVGIPGEEATQIMRFATGKSSDTVLKGLMRRASSLFASSPEEAAVESAKSPQLGLDDFMRVVLHTLDNAIDSFSTADVCTLGYLIQKYDEDKNGLMNFDEFSQLAMDLVRKSFVFNGTESLSAMHLYQLDALRLHSCFSRELEELEDELEERNEKTNAEQALEDKKEIFSYDQEGIDEPGVDGHCPDTGAGRRHQREE